MVCYIFCILFQHCLEYRNVYRISKQCINDMYCIIQPNGIEVYSGNTARILTTLLSKSDPKLLIVAHFNIHCTVIEYSARVIGTHTLSQYNWKRF